MLDEEDATINYEVEENVLLTHGGCQNYGPFLRPYYNTAPYYLGYPKREPNFDNYPHESAVAYVLRVARPSAGMASGPESPNPTPSISFNPRLPKH